MKSLKFSGVTAIVFLLAIESIAQNIIIDKNYQGNRTLRTGTRSNRNSNGANNTTGVKIYEFYDMTSWDTKFYDGKTFTDGAMTNGSNILTSATATFVVGDIGKMINVTGAGVAGKPLVTTIATRISATQVTLAINASTTVSAKTIRYGAKPAYTEGFYTTYGNGNFEMNYRLLFPVGYNPVENYKYPLIVMLHGAGERGNCWGSSCYGNAGDTLSTNPQYRNNDMNLTHGGQPHLNAVYLANGKKAEDPTLDPLSFPGFVLFPQNESGWAGPQQYEQAWRIIDLLAGTGDYNGNYSSAYNIDPDRIYLHGLSNGAAACWGSFKSQTRSFCRYFANVGNY